MFHDYSLNIPKQIQTMFSASESTSDFRWWALQVTKVQLPYSLDHDEEIAYEKAATEVGRATRI